MLASVDDEKKVHNGRERKGKEESRDNSPSVDWRIGRRHRHRPEHNQECDASQHVNISWEPKPSALPKLEEAKRCDGQKRRMNEVQAANNVLPHPEFP